MDLPTNDQLIEQLGIGTGTFAAKMAEVTNAGVKSDHDSQMLQLQFLQGVMALPPVVMEQREDVGFGIGEIARRDSRAAITAVNIDRLGYDSIEMDFAMTVGSHTQQLSDTEAKASSETKVGVQAGHSLFGKVTANQTLTGSVRHQTKNTRDTDMSGAVNIKARLSRQPTAEGLAGMNDTANEFSRRLNELRMKVALAKVDKLVQQIEDGEVDPVELSTQLPEFGEAEGAAAPA
ncbi:MAG: DUF2589 domain-containing protein [Thiotrichales bacterium]|nr:DUF2589 domain-containing protein [Thiotrichales bacterium]